MIKKTLKHFGVFSILAASLTLVAAPAQSQDGYWGRRDYSYQQRDRDWDRDRHDRRDWNREQREWERRDRECRREEYREQAHRDRRWDRDNYNRYAPNSSFYFGYRY